MKNNNIGEILTRLSNIEQRISFLIDWLLILSEKSGLSDNEGFSTYALIAGITAKEYIEIEKLFFDAINEDLSVDKFQTEFCNAFPNHSGSLPLIVKGFEVEGKFTYLCKKILESGIDNQLEKP